MLTYCVVTDNPYPGGGGESYMMDTMSNVSAFFNRRVWIHFKQSGPILSVVKKLFLQIRVQDREALRLWIKALNPWIVHHQGRFRPMVTRLCAELNIPCLTGIHFWNDILEYRGSGLHNRQMQQQKTLFRAAEYLNEIESDSLVYAVSDFVAQLVQDITGKQFTTMIPVLPFEIYQDFLPTSQRKSIAMMNVHYLKGGQVMLKLLERAPDVNIVGCQTECHSDLDEQLRRAFEQHGSAILHKWIDDPAEIYKDARIILVPSLVDETFCRVAFEAMCHGCVVICSSNGNLPLLCHDVGVVLENEDPEVWVQKILEIFNLPASELDAMALRAKQKCLGTMRSSADVFQKTLASAWRRSARARVAFFTIWRPQGLGYQTKRYIQVLDKEFDCFVFAFKPYDGLDHPCKKVDWTGEHVFHSLQNREEVTPEELLGFCKKNNIGTVVIPELCFKNVFHLAAACGRAHIRTIGIPNIEICRRDDLGLYTHFDIILSNSRFCQEVLEKHGIKSEFVGFSLDTVPTMETTATTARFLLVGGRNPFQRKKIDKILKAFWSLDEAVGFELTVLLDVPGWTPERKDPRVQIINRCVSGAEIISFHQENEYTCLLSTNEGLGLGFFEALQHGLNVVTYDAPPYNEVLTNGIFIKAIKKIMNDNPQAIIYENDFEVKDLIAVLSDICVKKQHTKNFYELPEELQKFPEKFKHFIKYF